MPQVEIDGGAPGKIRPFRKDIALQQTNQLLIESCRHGHSLKHTETFYHIPRNASTVIKEPNQNRKERPALATVGAIQPFPDVLYQASSQIASRERSFMKIFFEPRGVAVIGATPKPNTGGLSLITNLTLGYDGPIYPVNPRYPEILGLPCYPSVSEVPDPVELAMVFVPAPGVP